MEKTQGIGEEDEMRRSRSDKVNSSQKSVMYPRTDSASRQHYDYFRQLYTHMLIEDVALKIMPIRAKLRTVFIEPSDSRAETLIAQALCRQDYKEDLSDIVGEFFQNCAQITMAFTESSYEIVYLSDTKTKNLLGFELVPIQPHTLIRQSGKLMQRIPPDLVKTEKLPTHLQLDEDNVITFKVPPYIHSELSNAVESLARLSAEVAPSFALPKFNSDSSKVVPFDFAHFRRSRELAIAYATRKLGWCRAVQEDMLDYYRVHRELQFERFIVDLRQGFLSTLNEALDRVGPKLRFSAHLIIRGLPTNQDVLEAQDRLARGQTSFEEVMKPFRRS